MCYKKYFSSSQNHPYGMLKESADMMTGNDRYEGFGIDIIQELSKMLGFNYTFEVQSDNVYGSYSKKLKRWTGMLGKIIAGVSNIYMDNLQNNRRKINYKFNIPWNYVAGR